MKRWCPVSSSEWPKLPKKVIGALCDFDVIMREPMDMPTGNDDYGDFSSHCRKPQININKSSVEHWQWQTFLHELTHMIEEESGVKLKEEQTDRWALAWLVLWRRNGWMLPGE